MSAKTESVRVAVNNLFLETLPKLSEIGGKAFRKHILMQSMADCSISIHSACSHYNHAKKEAEKNGLLTHIQLGRAPGKNNGGRKRKASVVKVLEANESSIAAEIADETIETSSEKESLD